MSKTWRQLAFSAKAGLIAVICYYLGTSITRGRFPVPSEIGGYWCMLSGILVLRKTGRESFVMGLDRILGTFVGVLVAALFIVFFGGAIWQLFFAVFITTLICLLLPLRDFYIPAGLATAIVLVVWQLGEGMNPWFSSLARFIESAIGVLVGLLIGHIPPSKEAEEKKMGEIDDDRNTPS